MPLSLRNRAAAPAPARANRGWFAMSKRPISFPPGAHLAASEPRMARAAARAADLAPIVAELQATGIKSLNGIATALNARGVRTPRGRDRWYASQVARLLKRLAG
jgi:hypothetical protein